MKLLILTALLGLCAAQHNPHTKHGRTAIVHLFEWRWADIAAECERYLGPNGFGGVQISPPHESIVVNSPWRPWWERYQPISYNLCSRSGNENELRDMIARCNNVGVRDCHLVGLLDLALEKDFVCGKVADYMNKLIDMGVAGFRMDACKHMWPGDLSAVFGRLHNLNTRVTEFKYGARLGGVMRKWNGDKLSYLKNWGEGWGMMASDKALVFVDNHDNQRGHGAGGASIVTFWDSRLHKMAVGFMLAHPNGFTRVMSSYRWDRNFVNGKDQNDWMGPPSHGDGSTKPVPINPDSTCGDGWVCEHRWRQIRNMVGFRNVVNGQHFTNWWDNGSNQIAFGRGNRGFIVINNDDSNLDMTLNTGLPGGTYCDVISGQKDGGRCTGKQVNVGGDGRAHFRISNMDEDPFVAIHAESKL
ncbi:hypothetical protein AALO_G00033270 [Alosa alosa]|uniref:alpha-amylase n=1 Tax=Alosa alosa TaxID=278164 RepID=A0AAV6HD74_9TELE|nr:hypothetical protein AALO_G00033270 [Alosa alosa]